MHLLLPFGITPDIIVLRFNLALNENFCIKLLFGKGIKTIQYYSDDKLCSESVCVCPKLHY